MAPAPAASAPTSSGGNRSQQSYDSGRSLAKPLPCPGIAPASLRASTARATLLTNAGSNRASFRRAMGKALGLESPPYTPKMLSHCSGGGSTGMAPAVGELRPGVGGLAAVPRVTVACTVGAAGKAPSTGAARVARTLCVDMRLAALSVSTLSSYSAPASAGRKKNAERATGSAPAAPLASAAATAALAMVAMMYPPLGTPATLNPPWQVQARRAASPAIGTLSVAASKSALRRAGAASPRHAPKEATGSLALLFLNRESMLRAVRLAVAVRAGPCLRLCRGRHVGDQRDVVGRH
mmetsp:Transcript_13109/g.50121  ORF Transcript_13109/g.50121 Transcript_13109/m.50121 type:complete len:295 (-) Transcript_13109:1184-2068(-)